MESSSGKIYRKALRTGLGKYTVGSLCICKADEVHNFTELSVSDKCACRGLCYIRVYVYTHLYMYECLFH